MKCCFVFKNAERLKEATFSLFTKHCFVKTSDMSKNTFNCTPNGVSPVPPVFVCCGVSQQTGAAIWALLPPHTVRWSLIDSGARRYLKPEEGTLSCFECHRSLFVLDDASSASCFLAGGRVN